MKPPANASPAPVGSNTSWSGEAGTLYTASRVTEVRRQLGAEGGDDAEPGLERLAAGEVVGILRLPAERLARGLLDAREVYAACLERLERAERIVRPHHPHHLDRVQDGAGGAEEHGRPAGRVRGLAERRIHRVQRDRAHHEQTHVTSDPGR